MHHFDFTGDSIPPFATLVFDIELMEIKSSKLRFFKVDGPDCGENNQVFQKDTLTIEYSGTSETGLTFPATG